MPKNIAATMKMRCKAPNVTSDAPHGNARTGGLSMSRKMIPVIQKAA